MDIGLIHLMDIKTTYKDYYYLDIYVDYKSTKQLYFPNLSLLIYEGAFKLNHIREKQVHFLDLSLLISEEGKIKIYKGIIIVKR